VWRSSPFPALLSSMRSLSRRPRTISDFLNCMHLVQGVVSVLKPHHSALLIGELSPILENGPKGGIRGEILEILQLKALVNSLPDDDRGETADVYLHAIDLLHTVLLESQKAGENEIYLALLFSWPALLLPKFFSSLSIQEPVSLIIMAHFAGILGHNKSDYVLEHVYCKCC